MPNPISRALRQASESVPGQRPVRLPWQEPTLGERTAETLDTLADASAQAPDRLSRFNDRMTRRAQQAKRSARDTLASARDQTADTLGDAQSAAQDQLSQLTTQTSDQLDDLRQSARDRARTLKQRASERGAAAVQTASRAQRKLADQASNVAQQTQSTLTASSPSPSPLQRLGNLVGARALLPSPNDGYDTGDDTGDAGDAGNAAQRAEWSAERAERASRAASGAAAQMADALNRIVRSRGDGGLRATIQEETPSDVEIRVDEAAQSPLIRAADAVARVVAAAGETVYDYSGGHYGLEPVDAGELRRERQREKRKARPVTIIEGRYTGDKTSDKVEAKASGKSRTPLLLLGLALGVGAVGVAYTQRGRLRPLYDQVMARIRSRQTTTTERLATPRRSGPPTPTPAFNQVVSGQLIGSAAPAGASSAASSAASRAATATASTVASDGAAASASDGVARTYVAGEPPMQSPPAP